MHSPLMLRHHIWANLHGRFPNPRIGAAAGQVPDRSTGVTQVRKPKRAAGVLALLLFLLDQLWPRRTTEGVLTLRGLP